MPRAAAISPFIADDPGQAGPGVVSLADLLESLGLEPLVRPGALTIVPGVALVHSLTGAAGPLALRFVRLPHAPTLLPGLGPVETAVVLTAPLAEAARALRVASRLIACYGVASLAERLARATTREAMVRVIAPVEREAGETSLPEADVLALLASSSAGLSADEVARRLAQCGANRLERVRRRPLLARFLEQFWSLFAILLWVAGGFALLAGMPQLGVAVFVVIVVNGVFSFLQEYRAERALEALERLLPRTIGVVRGGGPTCCPVVELVPGDIVLIEEGDQVPADGQVLDAEGLRLDQGSLTGESHPVFKMPTAGREHERVPREERHELVFAGTSVMAGRGTMVVCATGMETEIGDIAHLTQAVTDEPSPLQREMGRVTRIVTVLALAFGLGAFVLGVASARLPMGEGFLFALGVIVANVPEGLLPTLTLALALGVQRMARRRSVVRRLSAVETLGATTVICTDKTGTLTENRMAVRYAWVAGRTFDLGRPEDARAAEVRDLLEAAVLGSVATLEHGDPTERALVEAAVEAGVDVETLRRDRPILAPLPFDSFRKRMTLVRLAAGRPVAFVKGAPRETLALCSGVGGGGSRRALTEGDSGPLMAEHDRLAGDGLRLLAVAVREVGPEAVHADGDAIERDLTLVGLVALWDPVRPEVPDAVASCRRAGIHVVVVTGDHGLTARAIARRIGLPVSKVVTGEELDRHSQDYLGELLRNPGVLFARTSPAHKLAIVRALKARGEVVAVTGDGVNDAPALKAADIGVAMGRRGSEVAKEAAVMVITDDNFASIVAAIRYGRTIYSNIGKFVTYIFASNVPELVPFLAFVFFHIPLPLTVMQILAVDLGTDLLPALALASEPPEPGVMERPPRPRGQQLLSASRLAHAYAYLGVAEAALSMLAFVWTYHVAGWRPGLPMAGEGDLYRRATTMTLAGIVAAQIGNVLACRTEVESVFRAGLFRNRMVWLGIAAEIGILLGLILTPLSAVFGLAPLRFAEWGLLLAFPPVMIVLDEGRKWLTRMRRHRRP